MTIPDQSKTPKVRIVVDTKNQTLPPAWRVFQGVHFFLAPMKNSEARAIRQQIADLNLGQIEALAEQDRLFADAIIKDWYGPVTPDGKKLPVNDVTRGLLLDLVPGLKNWVMPESEKVAESHLFQYEKQLGNSESGDAGSPSAPADPMAE